MAEPKKGEEITLESQYAVVQFPINAVEVTISAKVYMNGEIRTVEQVLSMQDVKAAVQEAEDNYIPPDAVFTLTPEGERYFQTLIEEDACGRN